MALNAINAAVYIDGSLIDAVGHCAAASTKALLYARTRTCCEFLQGFCISGRTLCQIGRANRPSLCRPRSPAAD